MIFDPVSFGISISAVITSRLVLNLHSAQSSMEAERSNQTEQDVGVLTTIPSVYVTPPEFDAYPLHDFSHRCHDDNNSWYTNETSDVSDARKDHDLGTVTVTVPRSTSTLHTTPPFSYNITEWTWDDRRSRVEQIYILLCSAKKSFRAGFDCFEIKQITRLPLKRTFWRV